MSKESGWDVYRRFCMHGVREGLDSHDCPDCQSIARALGKDFSHGQTYLFTADPRSPKAN